MACNDYVIPGAQTDTGFTLTVEFADELGEPLDMSGATYVADLYKQKGGASQFTFSPGGDGTTVVAGDNNELLQFTAPDTHSLAAGVYYFQANRITVDGKTWVASGILKVAATGDFSEFTITGAI